MLYNNLDRAELINLLIEFIESYIDTDEDDQTFEIKIKSDTQLEGFDQGIRSFDNINDFDDWAIDLSMEDSIFVFENGWFVVDTGLCVPFNRN